MSSCHTNGILLFLPSLLLQCCLSASLWPTAVTTADSSIQQQPRQLDRHGRVLLQEMLSAGSHFQGEKEQEDSDSGPRRLEPESFSPDSIWYGHSPEIARIVPYNRLQEQNQIRYNDIPIQNFNEDNGLPNENLKTDKIEKPEGSPKVGEINTYKKVQINPTKVNKHLLTGYLTDASLQQKAKNLEKNLDRNLSNKVPTTDESWREEESAGSHSPTQIVSADSNFIEEDPAIDNKLQIKHNIADLILQHLESTTDNNLHQQQSGGDTSLHNGKENNDIDIPQEFGATRNRITPQQQLKHDSSWQQQHEQSTVSFLHQQDSNRDSSLKQQQQQQQQPEEVNPDSTLHQKNLLRNSSFEHKELNTDSSLPRKNLTTDSSLQSQDMSNDNSSELKDFSTESSWQQQHMSTSSRLQQQGLSTDSGLQQQEPKHGAESTVTARVSALLQSVVTTASKQVRLSQAVGWVGLTAVLVGLCVFLFGSLAAHQPTGGQDREHLDYGGSPLLKDPYRAGLAMADREDIGDVIKRIRHQRREKTWAPAKY